MKPADCALRSWEEIRAWKERNASFFYNNRYDYVQWVKRLPIDPQMRYVYYLRGVREEYYPLVVGMFCVLYQEGYVNITFSSDFRMIRRDG